MHFHMIWFETVNTERNYHTEIHWQHWPFVQWVLVGIHNILCFALWCLLCYSVHVECYCQEHNNYENSAPQYLAPSLGEGNQDLICEKNDLSSSGWKLTVTGYFSGYGFGHNKLSYNLELQTVSKHDEIISNMFHILIQKVVLSAIIL